MFFLIHKILLKSSIPASLDYNFNSSNLQFDSSTTQLCADVEIVSDDIYEEDESFALTLESPDSSGNLL